MGNPAPILTYYSLLYSRYSRKILWLEVSPTNKSSKVIAGYYLYAVQSFGKLELIWTVVFINNYYLGCPKVVRADKGTENAVVSYLHPFLRHQGTGGIEDCTNAFRYGRSVTNQVGITCSDVHS